MKTSHLIVFSLIAVCGLVRLATSQSFHKQGTLESSDSNGEMAADGPRQRVVKRTPSAFQAPERTHSQEAAFQEPQHASPAFSLESLIGPITGGHPPTPELHQVSANIPEVQPVARSEHPAEPLSEVVSRPLRSTLTVSSAQRTVVRRAAIQDQSTQARGRRIVDAAVQDAPFNESGSEGDRRPGPQSDEPQAAVRPQPQPQGRPEDSFPTPVEPENQLLPGPMPTNPNSPAARAAQPGLLSDLANISRDCSDCQGRGCSTCIGPLLNRRRTNPVNNSQQRSSSSSCSSPRFDGSSGEQSRERTVRRGNQNARVGVGGGCSDEFVGDSSPGRLSNMLRQLANRCDNAGRNRDESGFSGSDSGGRCDDSGCSGGDSCCSGGDSRGRNRASRNNISPVGEYPQSYASGGCSSCFNAVAPCDRTPLCEACGGSGFGRLNTTSTSPRLRGMLRGVPSILRRGSRASGCSCGGTAPECTSCSTTNGNRNRTVSNDEIGGWLAWGQYDNSHGIDGRNGNAPLRFNNIGEELQLHQLWFYAARESKTGGDLNFGYRLDVMFGSDGPDTQSFGDGSWDSSWSTSNNYGFAMPQLYVEAAWKNVKLIVGHFYTIMGYEVAQAPNNFFYSHSYTFGYNEPFTHTGALLKIELTDKLTMYHGWSAGWDTGFSNGNNGSVYLGGIGFAPTEDFSVIYTLSFGDPGDAPVNKSDTFLQSIVADWMLTDRLEYVFQSDFQTRRSPVLGGKSYGINNNLFYDLTCNTKAGMRYEWFREGRGVNGLGGASEHFHALSFGLNHAIADGVVIRPEIRYDWVDRDDAFGPGGPFANGTKRSQFAYGISGFFTF